MSVCIDIDGDGEKAFSIHNDNLLQFRDVLGPPEIRRVSNVNYDPKTEKWVATDVHTGEFLCADKSREKVLQEEVRILQSRQHKFLVRPS